MNTGIDASDFEDAADALSKQGFEKAAGRSVAWALKRAANVVRKHVRVEAKPHRKTGHMAGNVQIKAKGEGLKYETRIFAKAPANLIVVGTKPHVIDPGKVMPLFGGKGAKLTLRGGLAVEGFARRVEHPGIKSDPFFHRGVRASAGEINTIIDKSAETMAGELAYRMRGR